MTWLTWRQFRTHSWITVGGLAAVGVVLVITGRSIADAYASANVAGCGNDCAEAFSNFLRQAMTNTPQAVYDLTRGLMYVLPALIGIFWGAPLIARELETGTYRLAWNQSITRTRWLATKLGIIGAATVATTGLLSLAVTTWANRIDVAAGDRITPELFGARGIVPIGYAIFAFMLGVTFGMLIRRTIPAMAATLAIYGAVAVSIPEWIRAHLIPAIHAMPALDMSMLESLVWDPEAGDIYIVGSNVPENAWILSNETVTATGQPFTSVDPQYCGPGASDEACVEWVGTLGLRQDLIYHPAENFWPLQWIETGILLALATLLTGFCFSWIRRRLA